MSVDHYENFPVASWLCPPALRAPIVAIYGFARTADDIADEGDAEPARRLADLAAYRAELDAVARGARVSSRWPRVFAALRDALQRHPLSTALLADLLDAFAQDVTKHRYADRAELLDYCRRSANPVGRLLLQLHGIADAASLRRSDAICTALQLANFWQDLGVDVRRGRLYLPLADCAAHAVDPDSVLAGADTQALRTLVKAEAAWAREMMLDGAPLVHAVPGRAGWELRLVVQGGLRILERIEAIDGATLAKRPTLNAADWPRLAWRAWRMRDRAGAMARGTA